MPKICEKTNGYYHGRVQNPKKFDRKSFRTKSISKDTKLVVGCPKGHYRRSRCTVGMQVQKVLTKSWPRCMGKVRQLKAQVSRRR